MKGNQQNGGENQSENPSNSAGSSAAQPFPAGESSGTADSSNQDDFRSRFHRSLVAPSPFGTAPVGITQTPIPVPTAIDPRLGGLNNPTEFAEMVAKMAAQAPTTSVDAAVAPLADESRPTLRGTGGTDLMPFLKGIRDRTKQAEFQR